MNATLYLPQQTPLPIAVDGLSLPNSTTGFAHDTAVISMWLNCDPRLVDVLVSAPDYVAYSVFDYEGGEANHAAMQALTTLAGHPFNIDDESTVLLGPILLVVA